MGPDDVVLREHLIKLGIIVPRPQARSGDPTSAPWIDLPTLRLDRFGREAAADHLRHQYRGAL